MKEEWRKIPGWENYEISIDTKEGRCRRILKHSTKEKVNTTSHKYIMWQLSKDGVMTTQQAARWIAITYPELVQNEWFPGAEIDHIDTDTTNNHPSNLRWVSSSGNKLNPITRQHMSDVQIGKNINSKSLSRWVIKLSMDDEIPPASVLLKRFSHERA